MIETYIHWCIEVGRRNAEIDRWDEHIRRMNGWIWICSLCRYTAMWLWLKWIILSLIVVILHGRCIIWSGIGHIFISIWIKSLWITHDTQFQRRFNNKFTKTYSDKFINHICELNSAFNWQLCMGAFSNFLTFRSDELCLNKCIIYLVENRQCRLLQLLLFLLLIITKTTEK